jgi:thioredoxin 1
MKKIKYFSAIWCAPCKIQKPIMEELKHEGYNIEIIDTDENQHLAIEHMVMSVPTSIVYNGSAEIYRWVGTKPKGEIIELLQS